MIRALALAASMFSVLPVRLPPSVVVGPELAGRALRWLPVVGAVVAGLTQRLK